MIDAIQILLIFVIVTLTILLFILGMEVFIILKELKKTFEKVNKILDDTGRITDSVALPIEEASDFVMGLKKGIAFFDTISNFFKKHQSQKPELSQKPDVLEKPKKRRFFIRQGKSLGK